MLLKQNVIFEKQDYTVKALVTAEYKNCIFRNCNFASASLAGIVFTDCSFTDCNFSMTNVKGTSFKTVEFKNCKLTGLNFSSCNPFLLSMSFAECQLNLTSFYNLRMKKFF
jgi:fluoroquinolone resistance protein